MFQVYYRSTVVRRHPLNGLCAPVANGSEFAAVWPEAEPESDDVSAAELVDQLAIGETIRFWMIDGDVDVTRLS